LPSVRKRLSPSKRVYRLAFPNAITAIPLYEAYLASRDSRGAGDDATADCAQLSQGSKERGRRRDHVAGPLGRIREICLGVGEPPGEAVQGEFKGRGSLVISIQSGGWAMLLRP